MKALKIILGILVALIAIYLILCLVGPTKVEANRTATIEAPASLIYKNISDFKNWPAWLPWAQRDTSMEFDFGEQTAGVGANYSWTSEKSGNGSMEILEAEPPTSMKTQIKFDNWDGYSFGSWKLESKEDGSTDVTWGMTSDSDVPFITRGFMVIMGMQGQIEKDFDKGLASLKELTEEQFANLPTSYRGYEVKKTDFPGSKLVGSRDEVNMDEMEAFIGKTYASVMALLKANGVEPAGPPTNLYYTWDEANQSTEMGAAIPVDAPVNVGESYQAFDIPAGPALQIDYYGDYSNLGEAHYAMEDYMTDRGLKGKEPVLEQYVSDPMTEPDTSKWLTHIIYLLEE